MFGSRKRRDAGRATAGVDLQLVWEYANDEVVEAVEEQIGAGPEASPVMAVYDVAREALRAGDLGATRLVFTGDFVRSVIERESRVGQGFTLQRGSGIVAAKTMPPTAAGVVDILVPLYLVLTGEAGDQRFSLDVVRHTAAHEAVHATIHHLGSKPFAVHLRHRLAYAEEQFAQMAAEQVEEHLAEYQADLVVPRAHSTPGDLEAVTEAWLHTIGAELPGLDQSDPGYVDQSMRVCLGALHVLWKALACFAAELRRGDVFDAPAAEIVASPGWQRDVAPWWDEYLRLLGQVPMTYDVDIPRTDAVVKSMGVHLQTWAYGLGFDFHDTEQGGRFRITLWD